MPTVRLGPLVGLVGQLALVAPRPTVGLGSAGWVVGVGYGLLTCAALTRGLARPSRAWARSGQLGDPGPGHPGRGVAALTADSFGRTSRSRCWSRSWWWR